jgi:hypothetical protein
MSEPQREQLDFEGALAALRGWVGEEVEADIQGFAVEEPEVIYGRLRAASGDTLAFHVGERLSAFVLNPETFVGAVRVGGEAGEAISVVHQDYTVMVLR